MMRYLLLFFSIFTAAEARLNDHVTGTGIGERRLIVKGEDVETSDVKLTDQAAADIDIDERRLIIGGEPADTTEFPFFVTIYNEKENATCGGTLINAEFVLTAAHCTIGVHDDESGLSVYFGTPNFKFLDQSMIKRLVRKTTRHPNYDCSNGTHYDVALLQINPVLVDEKKESVDSSLELDIINPPNHDTTYYLSDSNDELIFSANTHFKMGHESMHFIFVMDVSTRIDEYDGSCGTVLQCEQKFFQKFYEEIKSNSYVKKVSLVKFDTNEAKPYTYDINDDTYITNRINEESTSSSDEKPCCSCALEKVKQLVRNEYELTNIIIFSDGWCNDFAVAAEKPLKNDTFDVVFNKSNTPWITHLNGFDQIILRGDTSSLISFTSDLIVDYIEESQSDLFSSKIRRGDRLLMINGFKISGFPQQDVLKKLADSPTPITLTFTHVEESSDKQNLNDDVKNDESDYVKDLIDEGAIIHSVAIGDANRCTSMCRVDKVATCTEVPDPDNLPDIFKSFLSQLEFNIDKYDNVQDDSKYKILITPNANQEGGQSKYLQDKNGKFIRDKNEHLIPLVIPRGDQTFERKFKSHKLMKGRYKLCVRATAINLQRVEGCREFNIDSAEAKNEYPNPFLIKYAKINKEENNIETGDDATVIGLGCLNTKCKNVAEKLQKVDLTIEKDCEKIYLDNIHTNSTICAGQDEKPGDWEGDSGGPLMLPKRDGSYLQIGIVSKGCEDKAGIYTDTSHVYEFIEKTILCKDAYDCNYDEFLSKDLPLPRGIDASDVASDVLNAIGISLAAAAGGLYMCGMFFGNA